MGIRIRSVSNNTIVKPVADTSAPATSDGKVAISAISGRRPRIIYTVGISGSGKSTWAKQYVADHPEAKRINKDEIREEKFPGQEWHREMEKDIDAVKRYRIIRSIIDGYDAVVDDTNLNPGHHRDYRKLAERFGVDLEMKLFEVPLQKAIQRDRERENSVGEEAVRKHHREFQKLKPKLLNPTPKTDENSAS